MASLYVSKYRTVFGGSLMRTNRLLSSGGENFPRLSFQYCNSLCTSYCWQFGFLKPNQPMNLLIMVLFITGLYSLRQLPKLTRFLRFVHKALPSTQGAKLV